MGNPYDELFSDKKNDKNISGFIVVVPVNYSENTLSQIEEELSKYSYTFYRVVGFNEEDLSRTDVLVEFNEIPKSSLDKFKKIPGVKSIQTNLIDNGDSK